MRLLCFVGLVILFFTVFSGIYVFIYACVRRKELPWLIQEELDKTPYKKYKKAIQAANEWLLDHDAQDICVTSKDGTKLHGLWIPAEGAKATVLLVHGYRSTPLLDFAIAFPYYHEKGFNLLVPDQRSHGKSSGRYITFGVLESSDMEAWIGYHNQHFDNFPILLSGLSMGASTVLFMADRNLPQNVKGIIADCGFTSPKEIISSVFKSVTHLPGVPSIYIAEICARLLAGFSLWQCDTRKSLAASKLPVLMIHGTDDDFVPCEMTKEGYSACREPKRLFLVEGASHGISFLVSPDQYQQVLAEFIEEYII